MTGPVFQEIPDFLDDFQAMRAHCDSLDYEGIHNPNDDVFYPGVTIDIPAEVKQEVIGKTEASVGAKIKPNFMFLRMSMQGTYAPHQAHTDSVMGKKSLMLYLNRAEDCLGGTSFVKHESGMDRDPEDLNGLHLWREDHSNASKWEVVEMCPMEENKACIFDADLMHRAEPIGGFGHTPKDGRLVLTMFFDLVH